MALKSLKIEFLRILLDFEKYHDELDARMLTLLCEKIVEIKKWPF